jgi:hypothetical protein
MYAYKNTHTCNHTRADGVCDLVIAEQVVDTASVKTYVVFGQRNGFPPSISVSALNRAANSGFQIYAPPPDIRPWPWFNNEWLDPLRDPNDGQERSMSTCVTAGDVNADCIRCVGACFVFLIAYVGDAQAHVRNTCQHCVCSYKHAHAPLPPDKGKKWTSKNLAKATRCLLRRDRDMICTVPRRQ